ncbi:MAG: MMPL family transporter [Desulfosalsimonadaceae bacterium]|nr:MMPL family transporter [Desulfosalsimonadaceae bacterium]
MLNAYLKFVLKRPLIPILVLVLITILLGSGIFKIQFDNSVESFMPKKDAAYLTYSKAREIYGDNDRFILMSVSHKHLWSALAFSRIDQFIQDIEAYTDYNPQKEAGRIARFSKAARQKSGRFQDLLRRLSDDPVLVRLLQRKAPHRIQNKSHLKNNDIRLLEKILVQDQALKQTEIIDTILSPLTVKDISGSHDTLETYDLIQKNPDGSRKMPASPAEIRIFQNRLTKNPAFQQGIYAVDPETHEISDFAVLIKFTGGLDQDAIVSEIIDIADTYPDLDIIVSGVPFVNKKFNDYIRDDLHKNIPLVLLVVIIVFYLNFRSKRGILLPLLTLGMTEIWTIGLMGHLGCKLTPVGTTLPPLLISVGSSYAIHILNQYYADFDLITQTSKHKGIELAMSHISITVFLAGFTTFAAFLTVVTSQVTAIQSWGIFSAIGISFAVLIAVTLIPCALVFLPHRYPLALMEKDSQKRTTTLMDKLLAVIATGAVRHPKKVYGVVALVLAIAIPGALQLKVDTEFLHYFKESDPVRRSVTIAGDKFGGGWGFSIILDSGTKEGVTSPEFLNTIESIRTWLVDKGNDDLDVGRTDAFPDFIKRMHMAMNNDDPAFYHVPESRVDIMDYLEIFSGEDKDSDGRLDMFEPFIDKNFQRSNILVRLTHKAHDRLGTTEINHLIHKIETHLKKTLPGAYSFSITGYPVINIKMADYVVMGQMQGLFLSLLIVATTIMLLFKKFSAGPLAMIDMVVTILINFGVMGWFGIELDMVTSVIAAITIGIGVDDTIHFLNTYRFIKHDGISVPDAIEQTIRVAGKAIIFTSLALVCGFLMLITSNFKPIILFGVLLSMTLSISTVCSILLIPAAIRITGIDLTSRSVVREACGITTTVPDTLQKHRN